MVGKDTAIETEDDQGNDLHRSDQSHHPIGTCDFLDLEWQGYEGDHRTKVREEPCDEDEAKIAILSKWREVNRHVLHKNSLTKVLFPTSSFTAYRLHSYEEILEDRTPADFQYLLGPGQFDSRDHHPMVDLGAN